MPPQEAPTTLPQEARQDWHLYFCYRCKKANQADRKNQTSTARATGCHKKADSPTRRIDNTPTRSSARSKMIRLVERSKESEKHEKNVSRGESRTPAPRKN